MAKINPYLHFLGNTEEAFNFYKSVLGGEFAMLQRFKDIPNQEGCENISDADKEKIMHIALPINDGNVLMATDAVGEHTADAVLGNNFSLAVGTDSKEEADKIFQGLSTGGEITMPLVDTFWGAYFGMCKDKFGIQWMVNYDYNSKKQSEFEEKNMCKYVDGFVIPIRKANVEKYGEIAQRAGEIWKEHGALEYFECLGDDLEIEKMLSFKTIAGTSEEETVVFSWIVFESKEHRDRVNAAVMNDARLEAEMKSGEMPFDFRRMAYGGFKPLVALKIT